MRRALAGTFAWGITLAVPLLLVLGSVQVVMSPVFLKFEYQRPDMTPDPYGFTLDDRLRYGPIGLEYLLTDADIQLLESLSFEDGPPLFTPRELSHMVDVKLVTQTAFTVLGVAEAVFVAAILGLIALNRGVLVRGAIVRGAIFTLSGIAVVVFGAVVAWRTFFTLFHQLFFADGTWVFWTSDTLIRLYPEKFWFDAAIVIGALVIGTAVLIILMSHWLWRREMWHTVAEGEGAQS